MTGLIRGRNVALAVAAAVAVLAVFVSTGVGSPSASRVLQQSTARFAAGRVSKAQAIGGVGSASQTQITAGGRYAYYATKTFSLPAQHYVQGTVKCPASHPHPVSGLFDTNSPVVFAAASFPHKGGWFTRLTNAGKSAAKVFAGVVCSK